MPPSVGALPTRRPGCLRPTSPSPVPKKSPPLSIFRRLVRRQGKPRFSGDFAAAIRKLKDEVDGVILVAGSATLVQGLVDNDLLDEIRLMVFPVLLGSGKRIFGDSGKKPLRLTDSKTVGAGVQILTYERA